jgi:hypothetical protein
VLRRCRPVIVVAAALAATALMPIAGRAQPPNQQVPNSGVLGTPTGAIAQSTIPDPNAALLQPPPPGTPPNRFRRPGSTTAEPTAGAFAAPSRIGATPIYGSPVGFGAGGTGFDSSSTPKVKKKALALTPPPKPGTNVPETTFDPLMTTQFAVPPKLPVKPLATLPAQIYPAKAATRPGAVLPPPAQPLPIDSVPPESHPQAAATRPGAALPVPPTPDAQAAAALPSTASASTPPPGTPPLNTIPIGTPTRPLPIAESDAFAPVGIRGGSFMFFPAVELSAGYATNPSAVPGGAASAFAVVAPELHAQSNWSRHSLTADIVGSYTAYANNAFVPSLNRPYLSGKVNGTVDVTRDTQIVTQGRLIVSTDNPGSPNLQAGLAQMPIDTTVGGTLGVIQTFNPLVLTVKGTADRTQYQESQLTDGTTASNADRNYNQYAGIARTGFDLNTGVVPFVEVQGDQRIYDLMINAGGEHRNSTGVSAKAGATINLVNDLTGEMAAGYLERTYVDQTLPRIAGATLDGALTWQATALTTARFAATSVVNESTITGVSGSFSRDVNVQVDHAFRRYLIATAKLGYGQDDYVGENRVDNRYFASIGATYKFSRELWLKGELRKDWLNSTTPNASYQNTTLLLGLRLQR